MFLNAYRYDVHGLQCVFYRFAVIFLACYSASDVGHHEILDDRPLLHKVDVVEDLDLVRLIHSTHDSVWRKLDIRHFPLIFFVPCGLDAIEIIV